MFILFFICAKSGRDTLNPQLFLSLNSFVEIGQKRVVVFGVILADPATSQRPMLHAVCIADVCGLRRCVQ